MVRSGVNSGLKVTMKSKWTSSWWTRCFRQFLFNDWKRSSPVSLLNLSSQLGLH